MARVAEALERLDAESYVPQPDEGVVPQFVDDGRPATVLPGMLSLEEIMQEGMVDETERSADDDEQE